jgi:hypothetical protein
VKHAERAAETGVQPRRAMLRAMFRKLFGLAGTPAAAPRTLPATGLHSPYAQPAANALYNLLFCDDVDAFRPRTGEAAASWQATLFAADAQPARIAALAHDTTSDARVRALAWARLRAQGFAVAPKLLLGTVLEVPLDGGLDVLAAFVDGGVRYINQSGKVSVFERREDLRPLVDGLLDASRAVVAQIGPWDRARLPAPRPGRIRLSFLVSDGLYFGEGLRIEMERDALAGPVIHQATRLVQRVVALATA